MTKYFVMVCVFDTIEVEAVSQEDAELVALEKFDVTAQEPYVHTTWSEDDYEGDELIDDYEDKQHAAELENFDPITVLEKQIQTGELK
jgi:hypothetical protein